MSRVRVRTCSGRGHSIFADTRTDGLFVDTYHNLFTVLFYLFLFVRSAGKLPIFETHVGRYCMGGGVEPGEVHALKGQGYKTPLPKSLLTPPHTM